MLRRAWLLAPLLALGCPAPKPTPVTAPPSDLVDPAPTPPPLVGTIRYRLFDVVDTHDPEAKGPSKSSAQVTANARVRSIGGATVVGLEWVLPDEWAWVTPPQLFALRDGAAWVLDSSFVDPALTWDSEDATIAKALAKPPLTSGIGVGSSQCGKHLGESGPYGRFAETACFDALGLTLWSEENGHGPRLLRIVRMK